MEVHCKFPESVLLNQAVSARFASFDTPYECFRSVETTKRGIKTCEVYNQRNKMLGEFAYRESDLVEVHGRMPRDEERVRF